MGPPAPPPPAAPRQASGSDDPAQVASGFLQALARLDADALAALASERFSFDGEVQTGREAIRRTWRSLLAGRDGTGLPVGPVEVIPPADAVARYGPPPARIAPLARGAALVAVGDVGGRPVILFLVREAGRYAVSGMHD